jgi:hypothetical protein
MENAKTILNVNPRFWGPSTWRFIYSFISVYPKESDQDIIDNAIKFFHSLIHLLPCDGCRNSYSIFMKEPDTNIDDCTNFTSRDNIITFVFNLREKVNKKVDSEYCITKEYFKKKLDVMICEKDNKLSGYANVMCEVPFIQSHMEDVVFKYIKEKTDHDPHKTSVIINKSKKFINNPIFNTENKEFIFYFYRCVKCRNIYSKLFNCVHIDKISLEESFHKYTDLYNRLLFWGCTFLESDQLLLFIESQNK